MVECLQYGFQLVQIVVITLVVTQLVHLFSPGVKEGLPYFFQQPQLVPQVLGAFAPLVDTLGTRLFAQFVLPVAGTGIRAPDTLDGMLPVLRGSGNGIQLFTTFFLTLLYLL